MQSHPAASEVLLVTQGSICAGFISSASPAIPKGLLQHFQVSSGLVPALIWSSFSSPDPGLQVFTDALFGNNLPAELMEKVTALLNDDEVKRLKALFGGMVPCLNMQSL